MELSISNVNIENVCFVSSYLLLILQAYSFWTLSMAVLIDSLELDKNMLNTTKQNKYVLFFLCLVHIIGKKRSAFWFH